MPRKVSKILDEFGRPFVEVGRGPSARLGSGRGSFAAPLATVGAIASSRLRKMATTTKKLDYRRKPVVDDPFVNAISRPADLSTMNGSAAVDVIELENIVVIVAATDAAAAIPDNRGFSQLFVKGDFVIDAPLARHHAGDLLKLTATAKAGFVTSRPRSHAAATAFHASFLSASPTPSAKAKASGRFGNPAPSGRDYEAGQAIHASLAVLDGFAAAVAKPVRFTVGGNLALPCKAVNACFFAGLWDGSAEIAKPGFPPNVFRSLHANPVLFLQVTMHKTKQLQHRNCMVLAGQSQERMVI